MRRLLSLILTLGLIAAACGSSADGSAGRSGTTMIEGGSGEQTPIVTTDSTLSSPTTDAATGQPVELPESDYPDIVVADLAGGTVNLRELALGGQPTLLWFWAPH